MRKRGECLSEFLLYEIFAIVCDGLSECDILSDHTLLDHLIEVVVDDGLDHVVLVGLPRHLVSAVANQDALKHCFVFLQLGELGYSSFLLPQ